MTKKAIRKLERVKAIIKHEYMLTIQLKQNKSVLSDVFSYYIPLNNKRS